jgi:hypothetical protein
LKGGGDSGSFEEFGSHEGLSPLVNCPFGIYFFNFRRRLWLFHCGIMVGKFEAILIAIRRIKQKDPYWNWSIQIMVNLQFVAEL